jgi:hypothetical protein
MVLPFFPRLFRFSEVAGPEEAKNPAGQRPPPDSDPLNDSDFEDERGVGQENS